MAPSWVPSLAPVPAYNYFSNQLLLTLPIYSGGKLENIIDQAKLGQKISDLNFDAVKQQLKLEVTIGYSRVLHTSNLLEMTVPPFEYKFNLELNQPIQATPQ